MKLLIVQYIPRGARSNTRRVLEAFRSAVPGSAAEVVDLAAVPPPALDHVSLPAYVRRNYGGEQLGPAEQECLAEADRLTEQLIRCDSVVLAFPMYNFSVPAAVKAWLDAVMQKGRTWTAESGRYRGLLSGHRGLILSSSGGKYEGVRAEWDHAVPLARHCFQFMGFADVRCVRVEGVNADPAGAESRLQHAEHEAKRVACEWLATAPIAAS